MNPQYKNYECEVYVFRDLAYEIANKIALDDPDKPYSHGAMYIAFQPDDRIPRKLNRPPLILDDAF